MLPSGLPLAVSDDEILVRFLTSSSHFNTKDVKPAALLPNPRNHQTSVFRAEGEMDTFWGWRDLVVGEREVTVHGAALLHARAIRAVGLDLDAEEPPPRHANIVKWPTHADPALQKAAQKERALVLSTKAQLRRRPPDP